MNEMNRRSPGMMTHLMGESMQNAVQPTVSDNNNNKANQSREWKGEDNVLLGEIDCVERELAR
jgi:hypothetical protein